MDFAVCKIKRSGLLFALLALALCTGTLQATTFLTVTPTVVAALKCDSAGGPTGSMTLKFNALSAAAANVIVVGLTGAPGLVVAGPVYTNAGGLKAAADTATFTITVAAGCSTWTTVGTKGFIPSGTVLHVTTQTGATAIAAAAASLVDDIVLSGNSIPSVLVSTPLNAPSPLTLSTSSLTVMCTRDAQGVFTTTPSTFTVSANTVGGGVVVVSDPANNPSWLTVTSTTVGSTPVAFTATPTCSGLVGSSKTGTLHLLSGPASAKNLPVTLLVVGPSPLTLSPVSPITLSYTKNSGASVSQAVTVTAGANSLFFAVDTTSLKPWLTVDVTSGQAGVTGAKTITFSVTKVADTMPPGPATATVNLQVAGYANTPLTINLTITNPNPVLSVAEGTKRNLTWAVGQPLPTPTITAVSSDSPISYTISGLGGTATPSVAQTSGVAYNFGTAIPVTFDPTAFASAAPGSTLTGTITLNWTNTQGAQTIPIVFSIAVQAPSTTASLTGLSPANLPTALQGQTFTVTLYGSGFVNSTDPKFRTTIGVMVGSTLTPDSNIYANIVNGATIILTITVPNPTADAKLAFTASTAVILGVCNPAGGSCNAATGSTVTLNIGSGPSIQNSGITSASMLTPVTSVAPYDVLSVFGDNFCVSNGSGCTGGQALYGQIDPTKLAYLTALTPDNGQRNLTVEFRAVAGTTAIATAPLLFATNNQINLLVPATRADGTALPASVDMVVKFGGVASSPVTLTIARTDPGVFVLDGVSQGAIINPDGTINSSTNPAGMRLTAGTVASDTVAIYMTGLGAPTSLAANTNGGSSRIFTDCVSVANYNTSAGLTIADGAIIQSSVLYPNRFAPCFDPTDTTVNPITSTIATSTTAAVKWAGWVADSVAGLYQVNVQLPYSDATGLKDSANVTILPMVGGTAKKVPVVVNIGLTPVASQTVTMWVQPVFTMTSVPTLPAVAGGAPNSYTLSAGNLSAAATTPVGLATVTAANGGTVAYSFVSATGSDTHGVAVSADFTIGGSDGTVVINRAFLAGTYTITIKAHDTAVTGALPDANITLTFTVS